MTCEDDEQIVEVTRDAPLKRCATAFKRLLVRPPDFACLAAGRIAGLEEDRHGAGLIEAAPADRFQRPPVTVLVPVPVFNRGRRIT